MIQSTKKLTEIYTGSTKDLKARIFEHNQGRVFSTKRYLPWRLIYYEAFLSENDARVREQKFKRHGKGNIELKKRLKYSLGYFKKKEEGVYPSPFMPRKKGEGFTILEVIAAIFVMTVGVLGAYSVVQQIIVYTSISSSRLTAAYLAQEGIEIVRNIRDTNWIQDAQPDPAPPEEWNAGLGAGDYEVDWDDENLTFDNLRFLDFYTNRYFYYSPPEPGYNTKFKRKITIFNETADMFKVKVEITWPGNTVAVEEHLYNW